MKYSDTQRINKILDYAEKLMQFLKETGLNRESLFSMTINCNGQ